MTIVAGIASVVAVGCGSRVPHGNLPWCQVRAVVTTGQAPLTQGEVTLIADTSSGGVDAGGQLDTKGFTEFPALPGRYTVVVRPLPPSPEEMDRLQAAGLRKKPPSGPIPARFQSPATSPHTIEIVKGAKPRISIDLSAREP